MGLFPCCLGLFCYTYMCYTKNLQLEEDLNPAHNRNPQRYTKNNSPHKSFQQLRIIQFQYQRPLSCSISRSIGIRNKLYTFVFSLISAFCKMLISILHHNLESAIIFLINILFLSFLDYSWVTKKV